MTQGLRREMLQPASALAVLGIDGLVWAIGDYFELGLGSTAVLWGAAFAGICVWLLEGLSTAPLRAFAKAVAAAIIVWAPGFVAGAVFGVVTFAWWLSLRAVERRRHEHP